MKKYMSEENQIQRDYNSFKESGDLKMLFPGLSGNWEKDKVKFTKIWEENQSFLKEADSFYANKKEK
jgi:hypothetical protein